MMTVTASAKLNLTLEILSKRPDEYHEIKSVIQTISLCDKLTFQPSPRVEIKSESPGWKSEKSLATKAANLLKQRIGFASGAIIVIEKRVPMVAGLGGDSSDAAAVLRGLNLFRDLRLSLRELIRMAAELGSDVPLFLIGGTVLAEGKGESITPLPPAPHAEVVLLVPVVNKIENKTRTLYSLIKTRNFTSGKATDELVKFLKARQKVPLSGLHNAFEDVAFDFFKGLRESRHKFLEAGAPDVHLTGSGPALFTLVPDPTEANRIYRNLQEKGLESYQTDF
jgi:4-diphosphocytidyl-2-C-methyl-D-erythritol kinase